MRYLFKRMLTVMTAVAFSSPALLLAGTPAEAVVITVKDFHFEPAEITVKVGTTVRWENHEKRQYHNVYFEALGDKQSDYFFPDEVRERTFETPGTYPYICEPHHESHKMRGVVHVVE
ncbi:MAG: cupredoxin domain-containing protein [Rhodocyclales bacterium]|nr:cupredoxin domain-containing protein [Rhodocyclales bacterium]